MVVLCTLSWTIMLRQVWLTSRPSRLSWPCDDYSWRFLGAFLWMNLIPAMRLDRLWSITCKHCNVKHDCSDSACLPLVIYWPGDIYTCSFHICFESWLAMGWPLPQYSILICLTNICFQKLLTSSISPATYTSLALRWVIHLIMNGNTMLTIAAHRCTLGTGLCHLVKSTDASAKLD